MVAQRDMSMDLAKAIAMALVCIAHSYEMTIGNASSFRPIFSTFYMPLFMMICGYFSHHSLMLPLCDILVKKAKQLLLPTMSGILLICVIEFLLNSKVDVVMEIIGGLWFLKTLFICYLIVAVFKQLRLSDAMTCLFSCIILLLIPKGSFLQVNFLLIMFWAGYFLRKYLDWFTRNYQSLTIGGIVLFCIFIYLGYDDAPEQLTYNYIINNYWVVIIQILTGLIGSISVIGASKYVLNSNRGGRFVYNISILGRYTLGIYVVQSIVIERIINHYLHINPNARCSLQILDWIITPLLGCVLMFLCYGIVRLLERNKIINSMLFGKV